MLVFEGRLSKPYSTVHRLRRLSVPWQLSPLSQMDYIDLERNELLPLCSTHSYSSLLEYKILHKTAPSLPHCAPETSSERPTPLDPSRPSLPLACESRNNLSQHPLLSPSPECCNPPLSCTSYYAVGVLQRLNPPTEAFSDDLMTLTQLSFSAIVNLAEVLETTVVIRIPLRYYAS